MPPARLRDPAATTWRCTKCLEDKPLAAFRANPKCRSGLNTHCRDCVNRAGADWYARNRERRDAKSRAWAAAHPEEIREYQQRSCRRHATVRRARTRRWKEANADRDRARKQRYNRENRAAILEYERQYRRSHPVEFKAKYALRRARRYGATVEVVIAAEVFKRDRWRCGLCGKRVARRDATVDHIVPLARGGEHSYRNAQTAHFRCNAAKGARGGGQLRLIG